MAKTGISKIVWCVALVFAGGWMFRGFLRPGVPVLLDHPIHYGEFLYLIRSLIPRQHWVSGWCDLQMAGFPILVTYSIFGYAPAIFFHCCLGLSTAAAYKAAVFGGYVFASLALFFFLQKRASKTAAGIVTLLWCLSPTALAPCAYGLWHQYWGIGFFLLILSLCGPFDSSARRIVGLATLFTLAFLAHVYSAVAVAFFIPAWLMANRQKNFPEWRALALACLLAAVLGAFYLGPFLESLPWLRKGLPTEGISFSHLVEEVLRGLGMGNGFLNLLAAGGIVFYLRGQKKRQGDEVMSLALLIFLGFCLAGSVFPQHGLHLHGNRSLLYGELAATAFAATCLDKIFYAPSRIRIFGIIGIAAALGVWWWPALALPSPFLTEMDLPEKQALEEIRAWKQKQPASVRGFAQSTVGNAPGLLGQSHITALDPFLTSRPQAGDWIGGTLYPHEAQFLTESGMLFGKPMGQVSNLAILEKFQTHNICWVVACEPIFQAKLEDTGFFQKSLDAKPFAVYSLNPIFYNPTQWKADGKDVSIIPGSIEAKKQVWEIRSPRAGVEVILKQSFHPFWKALIDGRAVSLAQNEDHQMKVTLNRRGTLQLTLRFVHPRTLWLCISALGVAIAAILLWKGNHVR